MKPRPPARHCLRLAALALAWTALAATAAQHGAAAGALPAEVAAALAHGGVPHDAMVVWVEEVGATALACSGSPTGRPTRPR